MAVLPDGARGCVLDPSRTKAYFFAGERYWRYDLRREYGELRYPAPLGEWTLPAVFAGGIDAAVDLKGTEPAAAYFFKGDQCVRYIWEAEPLLSAEPIDAFWKLGTVAGFAGGIDAACNGEGPQEGYTYFFKDDRYVRFSWGAMAIDWGPALIAEYWNLGPGFEDGITACCTAVRSGRVKTFFFKGDRYVRYDWGHERADPGYPLPVSAGWPSGLAVWAEHTSAPLRSCADARLEAGEHWRFSYPEGTPKGQAGWQLGVRFTDPAGLAGALERARIPVFYGDDNAGRDPIAPGSVTRLAIVAAGESGSSLGLPSLDADRKRIGNLLAPGAPVILLGGDSARDAAGEDLLKALSATWPGHPVTGFTRAAEADAGGGQRRPGQPCDNPGLRVTDQAWAHEGLPHHRKTALNGQVDVHA